MLKYFSPRMKTSPCVTVAVVGTKQPLYIDHSSPHLTTKIGARIALEPRNKKSNEKNIAHAKRPIIKGDIGDDEFIGENRVDNVGVVSHGWKIVQGGPNMPAKKRKTAKPAKPPVPKPQARSAASKGKKGKKGADEDLGAAVCDDDIEKIGGEGTKKAPKNAKKTSTMVPSFDEGDESKEDNLEDEEKENVPIKRGKPAKFTSGTHSKEEEDDLGEQGEDMPDDEEVEVEEEGEEEKDLEEIDEKIPCDFCTKNSTHACFNCGKNGCDDHVLPVMIWVKKGKGRSNKKEKQSVMCCIDCVSNVEVVDEDEEEEDEWEDVEEDDDEEPDDSEDAIEEEIDEDDEDDEEEDDEDEDELLDDEDEEDDFYDDDDDDEEDDDEFF